MKIHWAPKYPEVINLRLHSGEGVFRSYVFQSLVKTLVLHIYCVMHDYAHRILERFWSCIISLVVSMMVFSSSFSNSFDSFWVKWLSLKDKHLPFLVNLSETRKQKETTQEYLLKENNEYISRIKTILRNVVTATTPTCDVENL